MVLPDQCSRWWRCVIHVAGIDCRRATFKLLRRFLTVAGDTVQHFCTVEWLDVNPLIHKVAKMVT